MTDLITENIAKIRDSIPKSVRLIAVTKTVSVEAIRIAYQAGIRDFAENRVQEAAEKYPQLQDLSDITWHLIGNLQTNKATKALQLFQWIQSVDSLKLALRLDHLAGELGYQPQVCLQVKIIPDPNKFGWTIPELLAELPQLNECQHLKIQGLMTIPPLGLTDSETLDVFERTRELAETIRQQNWTNIRMQELSMGMSEDYSLAVQKGATMIRLGRIIFGQRRS
ncbi:MAG TPA: YggS family pyridoxal phosphate-dependent enzyme [Planktothrix sp. UBA8407]|jgi:pyridoxal phosphate enzyme, YggS family|nr:YggS family pyridoxal phosphate-dependent enzyme [Planktothrix sp. UBA8402]HAO13845.1 YggS family pyridoxal phosphate-dependent enzyme [Planktothrix sp. UBA8407]HBK24378.1 YggS family pyridoxal phosphate-dependent enzyme [Planktothrix sp. UBA10369]